MYSKLKLPPSQILTSHDAVTGQAAARDTTTPGITALFGKNNN